MNRLDRGIVQRSEDEPNRSRLISTFKTLVSIDSPTGEEARIADYLLSHFTRRGLDAEIDQKGNVFARISGVGEPLFLSAHMDTVEPGRGITPKVSDGTLISEGSTILGADNKSTIAVILETVDLLREKNGKHRPLEILFTIDEESTNTGASEFDYSKLHAKKGVIADIAEPLGTIVLASPAYVRFDAKFTGKSGHAAYPEQARTVNYAVGRVLLIPQGRIDENITLNIGRVESGSARNTISGEGVVLGELRGYDEEQLDRWLKKTLEQIRRSVKRAEVGVELTHRKDNPGYVFDQNDLYIQEVASLLASLGLSPRFIKSPSVSDANVFNSKGLQVVNIGDGTRRTHTVEESIAIADMVKLVEVFYSFTKIGIDTK